MTTYEVIPSSQANPAEFDFIRFIETTARTLVKNHDIATGLVSRNYYPIFETITSTFEGVSLAGLRPAFLNTMANLCQLHADLERHKVSQYQTLCGEAEALLYSYALGLLEAPDHSRHGGQGEY